MAEGLVVAMTNAYADMSDPNRVTLDWTSAAGGTVDKDVCDNFTSAKGEFEIKPTWIEGYIRSIETIPGALGVVATTPPTVNYNAYLNDSYGYDITQGLLTNRSATVAEKVVPTSPIYVKDELTLVVSGAGSGKTGRIIIDLVPDTMVR